MPNAAPLKSLSVAMGGPVRFVAAVFLATAAVVYSAGSYFAPHFTAAALLIRSSPAIALNDPEATAPTGFASTPASLNDPRLQDLVSDEEIRDLNNQLQLYPSLVTTLAPRWAVARTRSQFSLAKIPDEPSGAEKLRITFSGRDREMVLRATDALAVALTRSTRMPGEQSNAISAPSLPSSVVGPHRSSSALQKNPGAGITPGTLPNNSTTLSALRHRLDQVSQRQAMLQAQLRQQTSALAAVQQERKRLSAGSADKIAADREKQLNKREATEGALRSQLVAATQTMNDLGRRYTPDYPEYLTAKDRVDELQTKLNQFQSKPFVFVPEPVPDNSKQVEELNQEEAAIEATLLVLQQDLDHNQTDTRRVQMQVIQSAAGYVAPSLMASAGGTAAAGPAARGRGVARNELPRNELPRNELPRNELSGFTILENAVLLSTVPRMNFEFLTLVSLAFGLITASSAVLLMGQTDNLIRSEEDLQNELPARIRYLGGIPRIKHEIISR